MAGCGPCSIFPCIQGTKCPLVHAAERGGSGAQGVLLSWAIPSSLHRGATGPSFGWMSTSTKDCKNQCIPPPEQRFVEAWRNEKGFPKPREQELSCSVGKTCLPSPLALPPKLQGHLYGRKMRSLSSTSPGQSTVLVFWSSCSCKTALFIPNQSASS